MDSIDAPPIPPTADPWVEPLAHDILALYYAGRVADRESADALARAHGRLWCGAARAQPTAAAIDGFARMLARAGLTIACLNEGNALVARELLDVAVLRMGRRRRLNDPGMIAMAALETRVAAGFRARGA